MPDQARRAARLARDVVSASGPEAGTYLQGQLSQDVTALGDGGSAWSWLLGPNGKVDALLRVTRISPEEWLLDTDAGWGEAVLTRLARFKLRTKVELAPSRRSVVSLHGPGWDPGSWPEAVVAAPWPGAEGVDVIVPDASLAAVGIGPAAAGQEEAERIRAGIPKMGAELDERTIPAETGLVPLTVSFTKGCYTGQELVARIDSRGGNVPRHLRGLRRSGSQGDGSAAPVPALPADLLGPDGAPAGTLTSAASFPSGEWVGLGYVRRAVDPAAELVVAATDLRLRQVDLEA